jgi:hypothetical protein
MTDLSPQTQAVLNDAHERWLDIDDDILAQVAAATLRAVVEMYLEEGNGEGPQWFLDIADELEAQ